MCTYKRIILWYLPIILREKPISVCIPVYGVRYMLASLENVVGVDPLPIYSQQSIC